MFEEIMAEKFPNLVQEKATRVQKAQESPIEMNLKRPTPIHIIIKMANSKDKERILKVATEKQLPTRGFP